MTMWPIFKENSNYPVIYTSGWLAFSVNLDQCNSAVRILKDRYTNLYEGWNFNSGNYLFTTDTK